MVGGLQGEEWKFIQKYLKKRSKSVGAQISGSTKDHFAGENEVCEISQTHKKGCEIISQRCEVGFQLVVFGFQRVANIGKLQEEFHNTMQNGFASKR